jgi:hypothetical protein
MPYYTTVRLLKQLLETPQYTTGQSICFVNTLQELGKLSVQCIATDWMTGVRSPAEDLFFSSLYTDQLEAHPPSYLMGTGGKARPRRDADHSPPSSAEVNNE